MLHRPRQQELIQLLQLQRRRRPPPQVLCRHWCQRRLSSHSGLSRRRLSLRNELGSVCNRERAWRARKERASREASVAAPRIPQICIMIVGTSHRNGANAVLPIIPLACGEVDRATGPVNSIVPERVRVMDGNKLSPEVRAEICADATDVDVTSYASLFTPPRRNSHIDCFRVGCYATKARCIG